MTRNLYLRGHVSRPLRAIEGLPPAQQPAALIAANSVLRATVDQANFPLRSERLAREIATRRPPLIGLQEVALWRHGALGGEATTVDYSTFAPSSSDLQPLSVIAVWKNEQVLATQTSAPLCRSTRRRTRRSPSSEGATPELPTQGYAGWQMRNTGYSAAIASNSASGARRSTGM